MSILRWVIISLFIIEMNADSSRLTRRKIQMQVEAQTINDSPSQPLIRNSQSNTHSPYSLPPTQHTHIQTYHQLPSTLREQRQQVFYLPLPKQNFAVYCIATKQSRLGIGKHERLLMLNGLTRQLHYYSNVPPLPIRSLQDITDPPKEYVHLPSASKFRFTLSSPGEISVQYLEGREMKEWKMVVGSTAVAREFAELVDQVRKKEKIRRVMKKVVEREHKVNSSVTPFVEEIRQLEKGEAKQDTEKKEDAVKSEIKEEKGRTLLDVLVTEQKTPFIKPFQIQTQKQSQPIKKSLNIAQFTQPHHPSLKIDQIIAEAYQSAQQDPTPVLQTPTSSNPRKLSEIDRILQQRRQLQQIDDIDSSRTIKSPKQHHLSLSKRLVHKVQLTPSRLLQINLGSKQPRKSIKMEQIVAEAHSHQKQSYQSDRYPNADQNRNSLLQQRRMTMASDRKKNVINQHSHPRAERSRSKSKDEEIPKYTNKKWLQKWVMANSAHEKGLLYSQFVDHCFERIVKMTDSFSNWHLFHRQPHEYTLEESGVSWTYVMMGGNESISKETELQLKWANWQYLWHFSGKWIVPLACVVNYKGLQIYCKAQMPQNSKYFTQVEDLSTYMSDIDELERKSGFIFMHMRLFKMNIPGRSAFYFQQGVCLPVLKEKTNMIINFGLIESIKDTPTNKINDVQYILGRIKSDFCPAFLAKLKKSHPFSSLQLSDMLNSHGLNLSLIPYLYSLSHQKSQYKSATRWLASQLLAQQLLLIARELIHRELLAKHSYFDITAVVLKAVNSSLRWDEPMLNLISTRIKNKTVIQFADVQSQMVEQYVISSLLLGLGISCDLKEEINISEVQDEQYSFWKDFEFNKSTIKIRFCPIYQQYSYPQFNSKFNIISEAFMAPTALNWQLFEYAINHNPAQHYSSSFLFKLLPLTTQIRLQQFLNATTIPKSTLKLIPHNDISHIYCDTHIILTDFAFNKQFLSVKQEVKAKNFLKAQTKLSFLLIRLKIWGGNNLSLLLQLYKLKSMVELHMKKYNESLASSLKTLQLAIRSYEKGEANEMAILINAHTAANMHFKLERYVQADDLFMTCEAVIDNLLHNKGTLQNINPEFLQIYYKRVQLQLMIKQDQKGLSLCKGNIEKYQQWKSLLPEAHPSLLIIDLQHFQTSLLQLRFLQLLHQPQQYLQICNDISLEFVDSRMNSLNDDNINQFYYRFVQISKCISYALPRAKQEGDFALEISLLQQADMNSLRKGLQESRRTEDLKNALSSSEDAFSSLLSLLLDRIRRKSQSARQKSELITFIAEAYGEGNLAVATPSSSLWLLSSLLGRSWLSYCLA